MGQTSSRQSAGSPPRMRRAPAPDGLVILRNPRALPDGPVSEGSLGSLAALGRDAHAPIHERVR